MPKIVLLLWYWTAAVGGVDDTTIHIFPCDLNITVDRCVEAERKCDELLDFLISSNRYSKKRHIEGMCIPVYNISKEPRDKGKAL